MPMGGPLLQAFWRQLYLIGVQSGRTCFAGGLMLRGLQGWLEPATALTTAPKP